MTDIKAMVDATRQLNQVWSTCTKDIEDENTSDVYNALCEIDEAVINLVEKVSLCIKEQSISDMYGNSVLAPTHDSVIRKLTHLKTR